MIAHATWELLPTFLVLAERLHFGRAAQQLGISRQTLTRRIQLLEAELDVSLVVRSTRRVALTDAGSDLRDELAPLVAAVVGVLERPRAPAAEARLSICVSTDLAGWADRVQSWINDRGAPAQLEHRAPDDAIRLLRAGELDVALVPGDLPDPLGVHVGDEPAVVVFPADHPAAVRDAIGPGDLADLVVAVSDAGDVRHHRAAVALLQGDPGLPYLVAPRIGTIAQGLVAAARAYGAAALVLRRAVATIDTNGLAVRPTDPPQTIPVTLLHRSALPPDAIRTLAEHLRAADPRDVIQVVATPRQQPG